MVMFYVFLYGIFILMFFNGDVFFVWYVFLMVMFLFWRYIIFGCGGYSRLRST